MTTDRHTVTVGQLRAELAGWNDSTPVQVMLPDRADAGAHWVLRVVSAGLGEDPDAPDDPVLSVAFPLKVEWPAS
ncbi:hypothetical protein [Cellulomonas sp. HZM]|uniref:hypothetical protein n=1 Tax=Cellulomonas sp. HZM TaxID=1454010 RepID=UPI0004939A9D|nr:hypothetical protein [Cellulomonas sp. HZM]